MSMSPKSSAFTDLVTNYMASLPLSCLVTVLVVVSLPVLCPVWGGAGYTRAQHVLRCTRTSRVF